MSNDIQLLTNRLLAALSSNYEVIDMSSVLFVITQLEQTTIKKEQLETTRLAKFINLLRKKTWSEPLARRAKNLLKKWREMVIAPTTGQQSQLPQRQNPNTIEEQSIIKSTNSKSQLLLRHSNPHKSLSQPTSPVVHKAENVRLGNINHRLTQPRTVENSSLPEYPCSSSNIESVIARNVPSTSRKQQQQLYTNILNGEQLRTEPSVEIFRTHSYRSGEKLVTSSKNAQPNQHFKKQPTSFANLIESEIRSTVSSHSDDGGRPSALSMHDIRSQSPQTLPHISSVPCDRQSPTIIEHSVSPPDLDQNSNPSRESSLAPPSLVCGTKTVTVINNNNTITSCSRLLNGEFPGTSIDLQNSNSNSNMEGNFEDVIEMQQRLLGSHSSEHRKSKKHKKEKRRHKQERLQHSGPLNLSNTVVKEVGEDHISVLNDEAENFSGTTFPIQENLSLSNSSLSMFPIANKDNITAIRGPSKSSQKTDCDLTFAGKFKKSISSVIPSSLKEASNISTSGCDTFLNQLDASLVDSGQDAAYPSVINHVKTARRRDGRSSVVVIESRSCSPFTPIGGNSNDSSESSSPICQRELEVINHESQTAEDIQVIITDSPQKPQAIRPLEIGVLTPDGKAQKRRGRKKGSKGADAMLVNFNNQLFEGSRLLSLVSLSGNKKVKTTKELLADIQSRKIESTTSSPALQFQSRPPSTSSETSLNSPSTSDACSTNATMSTVARSTPDQHMITSSNFRTTGADDDSGSDTSNGGDIKKVATFESVNKKELNNLIEEEIQKLRNMLLAIDHENMKDFFEDIVECTCTVRELEDQQCIEMSQPDKSPENLTLENTVKQIDVVPKISFVEKKVEPESVLPQRRSPAVKIELPSKPVKSIFDLDYDEENDPLRTFVEEAKARKTEDDKNVAEPYTEPQNNLIKVREEIVVPISTNIRNDPLTTIRAAEIIPSIELPIIFPKFVVEEDPNCAAKQRYNIQTNCITKYHINTLHNCYIPNVNGNWDKSEVKPFLSDEISSGLYERIVPQYNFLVMDKIPKDLSHIQFTNNYNKIKRLKLEKMKMKRKLSLSSLTVAEDDEIKSQKKKRSITPNSPLRSNCEDHIKIGSSRGFDNNMNLSNCTDSLNVSGKLINTDNNEEHHMDCFSGDLEIESALKDNNGVSDLNSNNENDKVETLPPTGRMTHSSDHNSDCSQRSSSCSNFSVNLKLDCRTYRNNLNTNDNISNNIDNTGDNSVDREDFSYRQSNYSEDHEAEDDAEEEGEYDEEDDDYNEDDDVFHEIVSHDMTSSTSTIGNKLVLTIKKTPTKITPNKFPLITQSASIVDTRVNKKQQANEHDVYQLFDSNKNDMAVAPSNSDSISDNDNLNLSKKELERHKLDPEKEACNREIRTLSLSCDQYNVGIENIEANAVSMEENKSFNITKTSPKSDQAKDELTSDHAMSSDLYQFDSNYVGLSNEEEDNALQDENNELLPSFNNLGEINRTGICKDTSERPQQFKEWHEVLQVRSYNDELLTVLPYVVID